MPQKSKKMPQLLTLQQTCELLQCHPNSLRQWDAKGILVAVRIGVRRDRRYRRDDILRFIEQRK
jgi:DNA-binding transcriptional MerR regulator